MILKSGIASDLPLQARSHQYRQWPDAQSLIGINAGAGKTAMLGKLSVEE
jgi:signal recognition particle GTPase